MDDTILRASTVLFQTLTAVSNPKDVPKFDANSYEDVREFTLNCERYADAYNWTTEQMFGSLNIALKKTPLIGIKV